MNPGQIAIAVNDALQDGKKVEILAPTISGGYEELASIDAVGDGLIDVTVKGTSWHSYLVPVGTILGLRLSERDDDED